mmetsp:Transcript_10486/g.13605  ORF Transcript_10486/g.13605 Transcript_10486/m.13605 type:complete len:358 (+) Transcript_10486:50-1123(+)
MRPWFNFRGGNGTEKKIVLSKNETRGLSINSIQISSSKSQRSISVKKHVSGGEGGILFLPTPTITFEPCLCGPFLQENFDALPPQILPGNEIDARSFMHYLFVVNNYFTDAGDFDFRTYIQMFSKSRKLTEKNLLSVFGDSYFEPEGYVDVIKLYLYTSGALESLSFRSIISVIRAFLKTVGYGITTRELQSLLLFVFSQQHGEQLALILDCPEAIQIFENFVYNEDIKEKLHFLLKLINYTDRCANCKATVHPCIQKIQSICKEVFPSQKFFLSSEIDFPVDLLLEMEDIAYWSVSNIFMRLCSNGTFLKQMVSLSTHFMRSHMNPMPMRLYKKRKFGYCRPGACHTQDYSAECVN